ncbi:MULTISPECIES: transposase [unclassified Bradyrhizobium]
MPASDDGSWRRPRCGPSFKVGVDYPRRVARSQTVGAHFGLTPRRRHQSGTAVDYEGRITRQGDIAVREALCETAASLLLRVRTLTALGAWGLRIASGQACCARSSPLRQARKHSASDVGQRDRLPHRPRRQDNHDGSG